MSVTFPNADKPSYLSGGADAWDDGAGGVVYSAESIDSGYNKLSIDPEYWPN